MDFYGCLFSYAGISSENFGADASEDYNGRTLIFASINTSEYTGLQSDTEVETIYNGLTHSTMEVGESLRESVISLDAEVITEDGYPLTLKEMRNIQKWLFSRRGFAKLYPGYNTEDFYNVYLNCRFISPEKIEGNGGVVGYKFTVITDSSLAWVDQNTQTILESGDTVTVDSDINDYIYPSVLIHVGNSGGDITIINSTDDPYRLTKFVDVTANATIAIDGSTNIITQGYYELFTEKNFVRLLDGENTFTISGDISSIDFTFNNRVFL